MPFPRLLILLQVAADSGSTAAIVGLMSAGIVGAVKLIDFVSDRRRDRARDLKLEEAVTTIGQKTDQRCDAIERQVVTLSAHIIGPDGENGLRGDLREVKKRVIGLEERERERLQRGVGTFDRRNAS